MYCKNKIFRFDQNISALKKFENSYFNTDFIKEGGCSAYVLLFIQYYDVYSYDLNLFFLNFKTVLKDSKTINDVYFWMGMQKHIKNIIVNKISNSKDLVNNTKFKVLNLKKIIDDTELTSFNLLNNYLINYDLNWIYNGSYLRLTLLEEIVKIILNSYNCNKTINLNISVCFNVIFYFEKKSNFSKNKVGYSHKLSIILNKNGILFFDPNLGMYHFKIVGEFELFFLKYMKEMYSDIIYLSLECLSLKFNINNLHRKQLKKSKNNLNYFEKTKKMELEAQIKKNLTLQERADLLMEIVKKSFTQDRVTKF